MKTRLYVGNVPYDLCTDEGLRELFLEYPVESTHVVVDKENNRPKGFCFVELETPEAALKAIELVNGVDFHGRTITVREAHDRPQRARNNVIDVTPDGGDFGWE